MRIRTILLLGISLCALIGWSWFVDAWQLRKLIEELEGDHTLDVVFEGKVSGRIETGLMRLEDVGILSISMRHIQIFTDFEPPIRDMLFFSGFPGYKLQFATRDDGEGEDQTRYAQELPDWSLYQQLAVQRLAYFGIDALRWMRGHVELVASQEMADGSMQARLMVDTLDPFKGERVPREIEITWDASGSASLRAGEAWYELDRAGRIAEADVPGVYKLVRSSSPFAAYVATPREQREIQRIVSLDVDIEAPHRVSSVRMSISDLGSGLLSSSDFLPQQRAANGELWMTGGLREAPASIQRLVSRVHKSLVYEETWTHSQDIEEILAGGRGDCTEFTDLFAATAEAAGYEVRKILGLAYLAAEGSRPAGFQVHAWNQVEVDGGWIDVDATWNQASPSALRIRFPQDSLRQLSLLMQLDELQLKVLDIEYQGNA